MEMTPAPGQNTSSSDETSLYEDTAELDPPRAPVVNEEEEETVEVIKLEPIFRAKTEYDGIRALLFYALYIITTGIFLGLFVFPGDAASRTDAIQGLASYTDADGVDQAFTDTATVQDLASYSIGLAKSILENAIDLNYEDEACYVSDTAVKQMLFTWTVPNHLDLDDDLCGGVEISTLTCSKSDGIQTVEFIFYNGPDFDRTEALTYLEDFASDYLKVFEPYLKQFQFNVLTQNPTTKTEGYLVTLGNQFGYPTMTGGSFSTLSLYAATPQRIFRVMFEILFLVGTFIVTKLEVDDMRWAGLSMQGTWYYWTSPWNILDWLSTFGVVFSVVAYYGFALPRVLPIYEVGNFHGPWNRGLNEEKSYAIGELGIWTGTIVGMAVAYLTIFARLFKHLRCHPGIAVYINVFSKTYNKFKDFIVWFVLIFLMFTTATFYQMGISGANQDYSSIFGTASVMAQLTMGFYDYKTLLNDALGSGPVVTVIIFEYWLVVFIFLLFAMNIILTGVGGAYDEAAEEAEALTYAPFFQTLMWWFKYQVKDHGDSDKDNKGKNDTEDMYMSYSDCHDQERLNAMITQHRQWYAVNCFTEMQGLHYYFQHPLFAIPYLDHWLWDGGQTIFDANKIMPRDSQIWRDSETMTTEAWMAEAACFLERPLTREQVRATLKGLASCAKLNALKTGIFQRRDLFEWHEDKFDEFIETLFKVFGEKVTRFEHELKMMPPWGSATKGQEGDGKESKSQRSGPVFINKFKNLKKTTIAIEKDVDEIKRSISEMRRQQSVLIDEMRDLKVRRLRTVGKPRTKDLR